MINLKKIQWKPLLICLAVSFGAEILAGFLAGNSMAQYAQLYQPPFAPPGWAFPVVWTILYAFMGIASYLVVISDSPGKQAALKTYGVQLVVNMLWSVFFFRLEWYLFAFFWLLLLWLLVFRMMKQFSDINAVAGNLMTVYLLWITFAAYLNLSIALHYL